MLQEFPSYHMLAMPTCAFAMSASLKPVAYSMACDAPCEAGSVIRRLVRLSWSGILES
jgi:hypothetical protein